MKLGLLGEKLPHSYSKRIFEELFGYPSYQLIELQPEELETFVKSNDLDGFNVTVPYKTQILPFLQGVDEKAARIGAVNAVRREKDGLYGTNTDYDGLKLLLLQSGIPVQGKTVLILGTGGTSKTAAAVCRDLGAKQILKVSRKASEGAISYAQAPFAGGEVIINTTPCGMFPNTNESPLDLSAFSNLCGVVDVIYHPLQTALIQAAKEKGIPAVSGLLMLAAQAVAAEAFFCGKPFSEADFQAKSERTFEKLSLQIQNLVLVGMPLVGKTTVGKLLAQKLNCRFYDTDTELEKEIGPIPDFIRTRGEEAFRNAESELIVTLTAAARGAVIATGGGAVLRAENRRALRENGRVILLERPAETLLFDASRPLSDTREKWESLRREREPLYRAFADAVVSGFETPEDACRKILEELK